VKSTSYSRCQLRQGDKENGARMPTRSGSFLLRIWRRPWALRLGSAKLAFVQRRKAVLFESLGENFAGLLPPNALNPTGYRFVGHLIVDAAIFEFHAVWRPPRGPMKIPQVAL
jgi:hypothetical protein